VLYRRDLRERQKGGLDVGKTKCGKGTKIMAITDAQGPPIAMHVASATPHEVTLVHDTLDATFGFDLPRHLIGDWAYDSDVLNAELAILGVEMIAPNRKNRCKSQDGRPLRRYKRRWKVERLFAWLHNFRRLVVRWERYLHNWEGMVQLGMMVILLRFTNP